MAPLTEHSNGLPNGEPKESDIITLVSSDGMEFKVTRAQACISGTIRRMIDPRSNFSEAVQSRCTFEGINGQTLEWVVEYFKYADKNKHMNALEVPDMEIPPEMCLELLSAADYLET